MSMFEDIIKQLGTRVRLSEDERVRMQHNIREYMAHTPVRGAQQTITTTTITTLLQYRFTAAFVVVALLFTSGVGVTFASNDALPGDTLYAVKEATEDIKEQLIFNETKQAEFAVERTHRRLQEIEQLAAREQLTEERERVAAEKFEESTRRANKRLAQLEETHPHEAEALRVALIVGTEARLATLSLHGDEKSESTNDARIRLAHILQENIDRDEHVGAIALDTTAAPRIATMEMNTSVAADAQPVQMYESESAKYDMRDDAGTAEVATLAVRADVAKPPVALATLVRNITKQRNTLERILKKTQDEQVQENIEAVLTQVQEAQTSITADIQLREYASAQLTASETLTLLHKTQAAIDAAIDIQAVVEILAPKPEGAMTPIEEPKEEEQQSAPPTQEVQDLPRVDIKIR